jgi:hypothetical protein
VLHHKRPCTFAGTTVRLLRRRSGQPEAAPHLSILKRDIWLHIKYRNNCDTTIYHAFRIFQNYLKWPGYASGSRLNRPTDKYRKIQIKFHQFSLILTGPTIW